MSASSPFRAPSSPGDCPPAGIVRAHLRRILESPAFRGSKRSQSFLEYTVEKVLSGEGDSLKERNLAVDVFGRAPEINLADDTIVRVGAREVRRRLLQYHSSLEAAADTVQIELPAGSYVPEIKPRLPLAEPVEALTETAPPAPRPNRRRFFVALGLGGAAILSSTWWWTRGAGGGPANLFWRPFDNADTPILVAVPHPVVYHLSLKATQEYDRIHGTAPQPAFMQRGLRFKPGEVDGSEFIPLENSYVAFGDMVAVSEISRHLASLGRLVRLRMASKVDFADMRETPTIIIGAYTNRWLMEITRNFPFRFEPNEEGIPSILESGGRRRVWALPKLTDDGSSREDYILITRQAKSASGRPMLSFGGVKQFGTEAGGRILGNPQSLASILQKIPPGWEDRNLQIILHSSVIGEAPSEPEVLAWHIW